MTIIGKFFKTNVFLMSFNHQIFISDCWNTSVICFFFIAALLAFHGSHQGGYF